MKPWLALAAAAGLACAVTGAQAGEEAAWHLGGYYKIYPTLLCPGVASGSQPYRAAVTEPLRLKWDWKPADPVAVALAYELTATVSSEAGVAVLSLPPSDSAVYRFADLDSVPYPPSGELAANFTLAQNLDRAFVSLDLGLGDLILGRQPVAFGSAKAVNPTDLLAPFAYQTIDKEERLGVDALRFRAPLGEMGEVDAGWVLGHEARYENSAWFVKPKVYWLETDASLLFMKFREHGLLGLDLARVVGGASAWLEMAYVFDRLFTCRQPEADYFRLSAGADYNLAEGWYGMLEYHFNGAGQIEPASYPGLFIRDAYTQGAVYLLGRHYLAPGLNYQVTPLVTLAAQVLWNLADGSLLAAPSVTISLADEMEGQVGGFWSMGASPSATGWRSEFGAYPSVVFTAVKYYF